MSKNRLSNYEPVERTADGTIVKRRGRGIKAQEFVREIRERAANLDAGKPKPPGRPPRPPPEPPQPQPGNRKTPEPKSATIIRWIEQRCYVPEGRLLGQKFVLLDWQKDAIRDIYDNPSGTRRAIFSYGRKNGKTYFAALLLLVHLCGPMYRPNGQLFSTALSREQAALIFAAAARIVRMSPELRGGVIIRESMKVLRCPELGTYYRALAAEATTAFGLNPCFTIHDELGQVKGPRSALYEAMETASGGQDNPLSVIISTQAPTDGDLLSMLIDDAMSGLDPRTVVRLYTAPMTDDPFSVETIRKANPAFGTFLNETEVLAMADDARRMRAREAEYRNLILNQRVEACNRFVSPEAWAAISGPAEPIDDCSEVYAGLDLSATTDLTALVLIGKKNKLWHVHPIFWLPREGLEDKARADRVPYDQWHKDGFLHTTPGASVDYENVAIYLREIFEHYKIRKIGFDRWNMIHLKPWLLQAGFSDYQIEQKWVEYGQGTKSMSPALRELEQLIVEKELRHGSHPVLNMCAANAVVEGAANEKVDESNRKLSKKKSSGRIDGMVALAMAVGVKPLALKVDLESIIG